MDIQFVRVRDDETLFFEAPESGNGVQKFFRQEPNPSAKIHVSFRFTCKSFFRDRLDNPYFSGQNFYLGQSALPIMETHVRMTDEDLSHHLQAQIFINDKLFSWPISITNRRELIVSALQKADEAVKSMIGELNSVEIDIPVTVVHIIVYRMRMERRSSAMGEAIGQSMEENTVHMVPPSESAVNKSLKSMVMMEEMNCTVCLEEMKVGSEEKAMPCSHVFHEDCIRQWLRRSHYCPICRFEVPKV